MTNETRIKELLAEILDEAKKRKSNFDKLKNLAVHCQKYELAAGLRDIELELFPETPEEKETKKLAQNLNLIFRMVELDVPHATCYKIYSTLILFKKKKGKFDTKDAAKIVEETNRLFTNE